MNITIEKQLNKRVKINNYVSTYKDLFINSIIKVESYTCNNMEKWNRIKYNKMYGQEQNEYNDRLEKEIIKYKAIFKDNSFIEINKTLFEGFKMLNEGIPLNIIKKVV